LHIIYLNLPQKISITSKGTVSYTYDAAGTKLYKTTVDSTVAPAKTTRTTYIEGFIYQASSPLARGAVGEDTMMTMVHEEGRARRAYHKYLNGSTVYSWEYDFFEKDHLGNTRMVLTQQKDTAQYLASGEAAFRTTENQLFANIPTTAVARTSAPGYPADLTYSNPNDTVFKVSGDVGGHKIGPSLLLKVMSGNKIDLLVQYFYNSGTNTTQNSSLTDVLASLASGIVNVASGGKGSMTDLNNTTTSPIYSALNNFMSNDPNPTGKPKAYLNWILLDDQLKYVNSSPQSGAMAANVSGVLTTLASTGIPITKNGFLYVWVSNETVGWNVFFDNLKVVHYTGPLLEETHYYPFGLTMAGISSKALKPKYIQNNFKYNGKEFQNQEFSDGTGLEDYDYGARMYDPQIGRWDTPDPLADKLRKWSQYNYCLDNPIRFEDPDGMAPGQRFKSQHAAAVDWARTYGKKNQMELSSLIYKAHTKKGKEYYSYTPAVQYADNDIQHDNKAASPPPSSSQHVLPKGVEGEVTADIHSHPAGDVLSEDFSKGTIANGGKGDDYIMNAIDEIDYYLLTPSGILLELDHNTNYTYTLGQFDDDNKFHKTNFLKSEGINDKDLSPILPENDDPFKSGHIIHPWDDKKLPPDLKPNRNPNKICIGCYTDPPSWLKPKAVSR